MKSVGNIICMVRTDHFFSNNLSFWFIALEPKMPKVSQDLLKLVFLTSSVNPFTFVPNRSTFVPSAVKCTFVPSTRTNEAIVQPCLSSNTSILNQYNNYHNPVLKKDVPEYNLDTISSIAELNKLSLQIGGPKFDDNDSVEWAKKHIWDFVNTHAEQDIDKMCFGQLSGLKADLGGEGFPEEATLEEARNLVWDLVSKTQFTDCQTGRCECCK